MAEDKKERAPLQGTESTLSGVSIDMAGHPGPERPIGGWPNLVEVADLALGHMNEIADPHLGHLSYVGAGVAHNVPSFTRCLWDWTEAASYALCGRVAVRRLTGNRAGEEVEIGQRKWTLASFHNLDGFSYRTYARGWSEDLSLVLWEQARVRMEETSMSGKNREDLGWKPHPLKQGDGRGGWVVHPAEYQLLHPRTGRSVCPFGVAQMDNGEIILMGAWHDGGEWREGKAEHPVTAFSQDGGQSWTEFETISGEVWGRPMMLAYLGKGELTFQASHVRYFSSDYGRTWPERVPVPPAANGSFWASEGNPLVDRDAAGRAVRIAELGCNFGGKGWDPREPTCEFLRWSRDGGRTWAEETMPPAWRWQVEYQGKTYTRSVSEGSLVRASNGWLVAALRTDMPSRYFDAPHDDSLEGLGGSISPDDGQTWSPVQVLYDAGRHHPHLLLLPGGEIAMTLIVRDDVQEGRLASYRRGCEGIISRDHGLSWDLTHTYVLDDFEFSEGAKWYNGECGHLYSTLLDDGSILTGYGNYLTRGASLIRWKPV